MQNPNISDPTWQAMREAQWHNDVAPGYSKDFSRKQMAVVKRWFMGEPYDKAKEEEYAGLYFGSGTPWLMSPYQHPEVWAYRVFEEFKFHTGPRYKLQDALLKLYSLDGGNRREHGWDDATYNELARFVLGDRFVKGNYTVAGRECPYPYAPPRFVINWIFQYRRWLSGYYADDTSMVDQVMGHFFQALSYLHPCYFQPVASRYVYQDQKMILRFVPQVIKNTFIERALADKEPITEQGILNRQSSIARLTAFFTSDECPAAAQALYHLAHEPDFTTDIEPYEFMPEALDITKEEYDAG
jgi:hypothetical protein